MTDETIPAPVGRWWTGVDYNGAVWPVEVLSVNIFGTRIRPVHPAPDAGTERVVATAAVYDSAFNHPSQGGGA